MNKPRIIVTDVAPYGQGLAVSGKTCSWKEMVDYIDTEQSDAMKSGGAGDMVWVVNMHQRWYMVEWMQRNLIMPVTTVSSPPAVAPGDTVFICAGEDVWWKMEIKGGVK